MFIKSIFLNNNKNLLDAVIFILLFLKIFFDKNDPNTQLCNVKLWRKNKMSLLRMDISVMIFINTPRQGMEYFSSE